MFLRLLYFTVAIVAVLVAFRAYQLSSIYSQAREIAAPYAIGPENADLTVVLFFDYQCPYCKQAYATFLDAMKRDGRVRLVLRPLATQGIDKDVISRMALAAAKQEKFLQYHDLLMQSYVPLTDSVLRDFAGQAGLDFDKLSKDAHEKSISGQLDENGSIGVRLGIEKVPTFLLGKTLYTPAARMPDVQDFLGLFSEVRAQK